MRMAHFARREQEFRTSGGRRTRSLLLCVKVLGFVCLINTPDLLPMTMFSKRIEVASKSGQQLRFPPKHIHIHSYSSKLVVVV